MKGLGINVIKTKVGDRYVLEQMRTSGAVLGGEQSGHIIFLEHNTTGDGLVTALQVAAVLKETGKPLSELRKVMRRYPQCLVNVLRSRQAPPRHQRRDRGGHRRRPRRSWGRAGACWCARREPSRSCGSWLRPPTRRRAAAIVARLVAVVEAELG